MLRVTDYDFKIMKKLKRLVPLTMYVLPMMAMAATIEDVVDSIKDILNAVVPALMILAFVVFLWGVVKFIFAGGDETKRKDAKHYIVYGLVGLAVMVAVWGIINIVAETFGVETGGAIDIPEFNP